MSPSVLYLAIIAIWAGFLVPAWVRRGHASRAGSDAEAELGTESDTYSDEYGDADGELESGAEHQDDVPGPMAAPVLAGRGNRPGDPVEFEDDDIDWEEAPAGPIGGGPRYQVTFEDDYEVADDYADYEDHAGYAEPVTRPEPAGTRRGARTASPGTTGSASADTGSGGRAQSRPAQSRPAQPRTTLPEPAQRLAQAGRSPQNRQQMLRSRRRMLTMLLALTLVAAAGTAMGLFPWWAIVPPVGMLVIYLLLLREIAIAEAEIAARHRQAAAAQATRMARAQARDARAAAQPEPTAEIIDISSRLGDQLYDQYADAAVRAVGD